MIRLATTSDLRRIFEVYAVARQLMRESGNPKQWGDHFPPEDLLRADIPQKQLWVVERDGVIRAAFALVFGEDPSYGYIEGAWRKSEPYATIHRVGSDGTGGIFEEVIAFCREKSPYLRIDTHHDNRVMQHIVEKHGFVESGVVWMHDDGTPRIAYEWYEGIQ